ncbi:MAG: hypothetical protein ACRDYA_20570 [Egibacteraceae bacterium]
MTAPELGEVGNVIRLIEVTPLDPTFEVEVVREQLQTVADERVELLGAPGFAPWVIVQTCDVDAGQLAAMLPEATSYAVTELRCRLRLADPASHALRRLLVDARARAGLVVGRAAVERAAQRRRLDLVVLACDLDEGYAAAVEKVLAANSPEVQVLTADLGVRDLGGLAGAKRAGCVGLARGRTLLTLAQASRCRGRVVSSLPGLSSSASDHLNGRQGREQNLLWVRRGRGGGRPARGRSPGVTSREGTSSGCPEPSLR